MCLPPDFLEEITSSTSKKIEIVDLNSNQFTSIEDWIQKESSMLNCDLILFEYSYRYTRSFDEIDLYTTINSANLKQQWIILTSNYQYYKSLIPQIVYYPVHVISVIEDYYNDFDVDIKSQRSNFLSFLSYHMHPHRLISLLKLYNQNWFDKCLINLVTPDMVADYQNDIFNASCQLLNSSETKLLAELIKLAPIIADTTETYHDVNLNSVNNSGYTDCYICMFTEADYPSSFITEKSIKPFLSGQLTAVIGNSTLPKHLKKLGFEIFEEYIDIGLDTPDQPDGLDTLRNKLDILLNQLSNLLPIIDDIWNVTYLRRKHNYELVKDPNFLLQLKSNFIKQVKD